MGEGDCPARQVPQVAIGYAGLKDRNAVTTQHFGFLPGREAPDWSTIEDESCAGDRCATAQPPDPAARCAATASDPGSTAWWVMSPRQSGYSIRDAGVPGNYFRQSAVWAQWTEP